MERLVRRCGTEPVAAACPPGDAKLMAHIRKQNSRKERRKAAGSEAGSEVSTVQLSSQRLISSAVHAPAMGCGCDLLCFVAVTGSVSVHPVWLSASPPVEP